MSAYLSLILMPADMDAREIPAMLAPAIGLDEPTLRLRCKGVPPFIITSLDPEQARAGVEVLEQAGCEAFAPTRQELAALGPTRKIKDLALGPDGIRLTMWREEDVTLNPADIVVLVRAKMSEVSRTLRRDGPGAMLGSVLRGGADLRPVLAYGVGGSFGLAATLWASDSNPPPPDVDVSYQISTMLDIHTSEGHVFQIDGSKFGFDFLGDLRGMSDMVNIDHTCDYFARLAPHAAIDPYFTYFNPPADHTQLRIPKSALSQDDPRFAFYSRWCALMYRHLSGGRD